MTLKLNDTSKSFDGASITWYKGSQEISDKTGTTIVVSGINNSILTQKYQARVEVDNNTYLALATVQIDRVKPDFYSNDGVKDGTNTDTGWLTETKYKAKAYDTGSGLYGYAIVRDDNAVINDCSNQTYTKADSMKITENGKYAICLRDAAGNVTSSPRRYTLQYIDKIKTSDIATKLEVSSSTTIGTKVGDIQWYKGTKLTLNTIASNAGASGLIYTLNEGTSNTNLLGTTNRIGAYAKDLTKTYSTTDNKNGITYKATICSKAKQCSDKTLKVYYENTWNVGTVTTTGNYDSITAKISGASAISGIESYTYKLYNSAGTLVQSVAKQASVSDATSYTFNVSASKDSNVTYSIKVAVATKAGNTKETNAVNHTIPGYCTSGHYTKTKQNTSCSAVPACTNDGNANVSCTYYYKDLSNYNNIVCRDTYTETGTEQKTTHVCCAEKVGKNTGWTEIGCTTPCAANGKKKYSGTCAYYDKYDTSHWCTNNCSEAALTYKEEGTCGGKTETSSTCGTLTCKTSCGYAGGTIYSDETHNYVSTYDNKTSCGTTTTKNGCSKKCDATAACSTTVKFTTLLNSGNMCPAANPTSLTKTGIKFNGYTKIEYTVEMHTENNGKDVVGQRTWINFTCNDSKNSSTWNRLFGTFESGGETRNGIGYVSTWNTSNTFTKTVTIPNNIKTCKSATAELYNIYGEDGICTGVVSIVNVSLKFTN